MLRYLQSVILVYPSVLGENYSDYICSYNDSYYIKLEKMEIMYLMTNEHNAKLIMNEFFEYHKDFNQDYVKISIEYISKICLKINMATPHGIDLYIKILQNLGDKGGMELIEAITISCVKIVRVFPKVKGGTQIVTLISQRYKELYSAEAKASYIWLLGEYCERIDKAGGVEKSGLILENFTKSYFTQPAEVQQRILSTGIKMYLLQIEPIDSVMGDLIQSISDKSTNPDLRDRGYIYWRMLYKDDDQYQQAKKIVFNDIQAVEVDTKVSETRIEEARQNLRYGGRVSAVLNRPPEDLFKGKEFVARGTVELDSEVIVGPVQPGTTTTPAQPAPQDPKSAEPVQNVKEVKQAGASPAGGKKIGSPDKVATTPGGTKKNTEFNLLDFDITSAPEENKVPVYPEHSNGVSSNKKPTNQEENLFEDDAPEEDLFNDAPTTSAGLKFIPMPEEVT